ncbi:unnamed protein product [Moneuplotes crassus]|uniref:Uncharacterized protein n=1 Tax=Euplotes crassus TaxID=5936 RepID=A0AAD1X8G7_EUPCR|nr:unnamed protein product [Moneuplotes crassus]
MGACFSGKYSKDYTEQGTIELRKDYQESEGGNEKPKVKKSSTEFYSQLDDTVFSEDLCREIDLYTQEQEKRTFKGENMTFQNEIPKLAMHIEGFYEVTWRRIETVKMNAPSGWKSIFNLVNEKIEKENEFLHELLKRQKTLSNPKKMMTHYFNFIGCTLDRITTALNLKHKTKHRRTFKNRLRSYFLKRVEIILKSSKKKPKTQKELVKIIADEVRQGRCDQGLLDEIDRIRMNEEEKEGRGMTDSDQQESRVIINSSETSLKSQFSSLSFSNNISSGRKYKERIMKKSTGGKSTVLESIFEDKD